MFITAHSTGPGPGTDESTPHFQTVLLDPL
jgi:hypothetical protein